MDEVSTVNFELTEAQYAANEVAESWVQRFLVAFMACLQFLSPIMAAGPYDAVVSNILDKVRERREGELFRGPWRGPPFSALGAQGPGPVRTSPWRRGRACGGAGRPGAPFARKSSPEKKKTLRPHCSPSTPPTFPQVVDRVEALLRLKRFNQLGGLQLDRNIRDLVTSLADLTQRSVRDKFARLTQVATLLSCESMAEVQEFFGPDAANTAYTWRLSDTQIREVLSQRHDFSQGDIARLVL